MTNAKGRLYKNFHVQLIFIANQYSKLLVEQERITQETAFRVVKDCLWVCKRLLLTVSKAAFG